MTATGLKMRFADTPDKLKNVRLMTQQKLVPHLQKNLTYYVYADAIFYDAST